MPASSKDQGRVESTTTAQTRFTMALTQDVGEQLDRIGKRMSDAVFAAAGVQIELSRPQVVASLAKTALAVQADDAPDKPADDTPAS